MPTIELEYSPRPQQFEIHKSLKRFNVIICHRRFGKTVMCVNQLIAAALRCKKERPRFAYIAPFYRQAKTIAWDYLKHYTRPIPGVTYNESELRVDLPNGARITLYGADNYDTLRGIYLDGAVMDEFAQMPLKAWTEVIRPALSDRQGWVIFIGTPKGHNAFYEIYTRAQTDPDWYAAMFRASETKILPKEELAAAQRDMSEDEYNQEFECSFEAAIQGAYYAQQLQAMRNARRPRIGKVPFDKDLLVHTAWDLGFDDATAIVFFQTLGKEIRLIDYEQHSGSTLQFYATLLEKKGYTYGTHYLPHDAAPARLEAGGKSIQQQLWDLGVSNTVIVPRQDPIDGIMAVRALFPNFWIDEEKCAHLLECLTHYHSELDENRSTPTHLFFKSKPEHDWSSHGADAVRCLAMGYEEEYVEDDDESEISVSFGGRLA